MTQSPKDLINECTEVASLPEVYTKINDAVNSPTASMADIAAIVSEDPGLSSRLLRLANSAFYGIPRGVDTISQAVSVLGTQQVRDLALASSVVGMFKGIPEDLMTMKGFWSHSISVAMAARLLAVARRQANVERFFVAGMLHDIGRLIMIKELPSKSRAAFELSKERGILLVKAERDIIGFDHSAVGRALLDAWLLPPNLGEAVEFHHAPRSATQYPLETAIVHVADIIAHVMNYGGPREHFVPPLYPAAWRELDIQIQDLSPIIEQIEIEVGSLVRILVTG
jgi:putative nucleotidyltransferase with HDIG domain